MEQSTEQAAQSAELAPVTIHMTAHHQGNAKSTVLPSSVSEKKSVGPQAYFSYIYSIDQSRPNLQTGGDLEFSRTLAESNACLRLLQANGSVFRAVDLAPDSQPHFHRSQSLDYVTIVAGEVELLMEDETRALCRTGDVIVQRGTMHAWRNASKTQWARMIAVMIESEPIVRDGTLLEEVGASREKRSVSSPSPDALNSSIQNGRRSWLLPHQAVHGGTKAALMWGWWAFRTIAWLLGFLTG